MKQLNEKQQKLYDDLIKTLNLIYNPDKLITQLDSLVESLLESEE